MTWLDPVRAALDARATPAPVFFRDDDAGWDGPGLAAMLSLFASWSVPVDVAAIPAELRAPLLRLLDRQPPLVRVHQHGYAHRNHEPVGRKCEFGASRSRAEQAADVAAGWAMLQGELGDRVDPVFTPPWNRCTATTADAVVAAGLAVLSRDRSAGRVDRADLVEVPVTVDWFGHRKGVRWTAAELAEQLAAAVRGAEPIGVMLHHAVSDAAERAGVAELLALLTGHPMARPTTIMALAGHPVATR